MMERNAFNHFQNWWNIKKKLTPEQYVEFDKALCKVQFLECHIDDITFEDVTLELVWEAMKYTLKQSLDGYFAKKDITYDEYFKNAKNAENTGIDTASNTPSEPPTDTPRQGGYQPPTDTPSDTPCHTPTEGGIGGGCHTPPEAYIRERVRVREREDIENPPLNISPLKRESDRKSKAKETLLDKCQNDTQIKMLLEGIGKTEQFLKELIAYRRKINKPFKSELGVKGVLKNLQNTSITTGKSVDELFSVMQDREWLTIQADYLRRNKDSPKNSQEEFKQKASEAISKFASRAKGVEYAT